MLLRADTGVWGPYHHLGLGPLSWWCRTVWPHAGSGTGTITASLTDIGAQSDAPQLTQSFDGVMM